jgi:hypothetical protein
LPGSRSQTIVTAATRQFVARGTGMRTEVADQEDKDV